MFKIYRQWKKKKQQHQQETANDIIHSERRNRCGKELPRWLISIHLPLHVLSKFLFVYLSNLEDCFIYEYTLKITAFFCTKTDFERKITENDLKMYDA